MRRYLYFAVFISGMTSLAVEMAASRLLDNVFGTSNLVWASIIGLILIYLTLGYFIGGRWADRSPRPSTMYAVLSWAGFATGVVPVISKPVLRLSAQAFDNLEMGILLGSFAAVMILFIIPVTLMGTISPFAIRLAITDPAEAGKTSGRIYAISTLGSFLGTFLPTLLLIPLVGTFFTFIIFASVLLLVGLVGRYLSGGWKSLLPFSWMPVALVLLAIFALRGPYKTTAGMIYEKESAYNYIQVLETDGYHLLRLNEGQGVHSVYHPTILNYYGPWEQVLVAPFFNAAPHTPDQVQSLAIVGLAAGTAAREASVVYPNIQIDGFEIDPTIIEVGKQYFGMDLPNLNAVAVDGRWGLEHSDKKYDIISVDAYRPPYIPAHLTTVEFFEICKQHMTEDGVLVINVGRSPNDRSLINALGTTIGTVFSTVHVMDLPNTFNSILFATVQPTQPENLAANLLQLEAREDVHPLLIETMQTTLANLQPPPEKDIVFTDDRAPIEWYSNALVLNFLFSDQMENLE